MKLKRTPGIYLAGFMGAGKTTVGMRLADRLGWTFADVDDDIEQAVEAGIVEIFRDRGEDEFRRIETAALRVRVEAIERGRPMVLALGGGAFAQQANFELLENNGVTIWLDCPLDMVKQRVAYAAHRPLARDLETLEQLYESRRAAYSRADFRVAIEGDDPEIVVACILGLPIF